MSQPTPLSVSEAEIEAAAEAIWNAESIRAIGKPRSVVWREVLSEHQDRYRQMARAALAAAAQVRAQGHAGELQEIYDLLGIGDDYAGAVDKIRALIDGKSKPGLMPIYGATEDLQQDLVQATTEPAEASRDHPNTEVPKTMERLLADLRKWDGPHIGTRKRDG